MIRVKRGVKADLPTLWPGEPGMCLDTGEFYVGGNHGNNRINPWITPEAYGAKGDGLTDDTAAIQAAVNTRRPVCLSGNYVITDTLSLPEGANIFGMSALVDARIDSRIDAVASITINAANKAIFALDQTDIYLGYVWAVKIANLRLVKGTGANASGAAIDLTNSANIDVKNVAIDGFYNGVYVDVGMTSSFSDMNIQNCANACIYIDDSPSTTSQVFNNVTMRASPYGVIIRSALPWGCGNTTFNDCLIESTTVGGVILEKGAMATFNNLYCENVPDSGTSPDGCIFECGASGSGPISMSNLLVNGGTIGSGFAPAGSAIFRTVDWFIINIDGGRYYNTTKFHDQIVITGDEYLCAINLNGVSVIGTDLYLTFDSNPQLHGSFIDGSLPVTEWFRNKVRLYPTLTANSITTGTISERMATLTNLSVVVPNGTCDGETDGVVDNWEADRATLDIAAGGCLQITHTETVPGTGDYPNAAAHQELTGLVPGVTYTISAYVKSGTSGDGLYHVNVYPKVAYAPLVTIAGTSSGGWVEATDTFVNPEGNSDVWIYLVKNNTTPGTMLFDTVTLVVSALTPVADGYLQYSDDIAPGNAAPHFKTENGRIIKLYQQDHITDPGEVTADNTTAIKAILAVLENCGLLSNAINGAGTISAVSTLSGTAT